MLRLYKITYMHGMHEKTAHDVYGLSEENAKKNFLQRCERMGYVFIIVLNVELEKKS